MPSSSGRAYMKLLGTRQAAFCKGHIVLVGLLLPPIIGSGTAGTAAVVGDGRSAIDVTSEKKDGRLEDMLRRRIGRILRNGCVLPERTGTLPLLGSSIPGMNSIRRRTSSLSRSARMKHPRLSHPRRERFRSQSRKRRSRPSRSPRPRSVRRSPSGTGNTRS